MVETNPRTNITKLDRETRQGWRPDNRTISTIPIYEMLSTSSWTFRPLPFHPTIISVPTVLAASGVAADDDLVGHSSSESGNGVTFRLLMIDFASNNHELLPLSRQYFLLVIFLNVVCRLVIVQDDWITTADVCHYDASMPSQCL